jgi:hypothetical protein
MITDRQNTFSVNQAITTAATTVSTDIIDTGVNGININTNRGLQLYVAVTEAFVGGTNVTVNLIQSATENMASPTVLVSSGTIATAQLTRGAVLLRLAVPRTSQRFLALQYVSTGTYTAGRLFGGLVLDTDDTLIPTYETGR